MRVLRFAVASLAVAALAVGCSEQNEPTASTDALTGPSYKISNAPSMAGRVIRGEAHGMFDSYYERTPTGEAWYAWTGVPEDVDELVLCGADTSQAWFYWYQDVDKEGVNRLIMREDANIVFWNADEFFTEWDENGLCAAFHLDPLLESTVSHEIGNDNDLFGETGRNVWGYKVHGKIMYDGERYNLSYHIKLQWLEHKLLFRFLTEQGMIH